MNHDIRLEKVQYYGIRGLPLNCFNSHLSGRHKGVKIINPKSDNKAFTIGVPQTSVLGPLLFLRYINNIYKSTPKVCFRLLIDDTCLLYSN